MKKIYVAFLLSLLSISIYAQEDTIQLTATVETIVKPSGTEYPIDMATPQVILNYRQDVLTFHTNQINSNLMIDNSYKYPGYLNYVLYDQRGNQIYKRYTCRSYKYDYSYDYTMYESLMMMFLESVDLIDTRH